MCITEYNEAETMAMFDEEEVISALWPKTTLGEDSHGNG